MSIAQNARVVAWARRVVAWPNRHRRLAFFSTWMMRRLARFAMNRVGAKLVNQLDDIFLQWQRSSPALADYRLVKIEADTVHAEIHSNCALRGTGDVDACHRMMEYDREIMRHVGGELTVLKSQASEGRTFCEVAIRRRGSSMSDLVPAHRLARNHNVTGQPPMKGELK